MTWLFKMLPSTMTYSLQTTLGLLSPLIAMSMPAWHKILALLVQLTMSQGNFTDLILLACSNCIMNKIKSLSNDIPMQL